jgi:tetratricopeptide (TPR) repeat protein
MQQGMQKGVQQGTPRWVLPALGLLLLLALAVIVWLPASLDPAPSTPPEPAGTTAEPPASGAANQPTRVSGASSTATDAAPWTDAQAARLRKEAQEAAADLLDLQFALQERGVEAWAPAPFAEVQTFAADGDARYRERLYEEATAHYQQGLTALQALQHAMPQELKRLLEQAQQAIEAGDAAAAQTALTVAALIAPDDPDIASLLHRADVLPQLLPLLEQATAAEAAGDLAQAQQLLQQATALDPQHQRAQSELDRVAAKAARQAFNDAMSEGYAALGEGRFDSARKSFRKAATLQPDSSEAASALQEVNSAETAGRLAALDKRGRSYEQQEQWQQAVEAYEQAQKIDGSVLFAQEGLQRSRTRAQLDQQFRKIIEKPARLADTAVADAAARLLIQARQVPSGGPVLEQQIRRLDTLLIQANTTVAVTLRSDQETEVIVYKVAKLGRFNERELTLRPGTYTALGTRDGYRDVRRSFTLAADAKLAPVTIICTEPI